jgi:hypothetical protein
MNGIALTARITAATFGMASAGHAIAADNASLVNRPVRVLVEGLTTAPVTGKLIAVEGCLYVQFDQRQQGTITSVRLDQVTTLQVTAGAAAPALQAILMQEPRKCFEEGAG